MSEFLDKPGTKLFLLKPQNIQSNSKGFDIIKEQSLKNPENVVIKKATESFSNRVKELLDIGEFFTLGDNRKFRIETNPEKLGAVVNFNSRPIVYFLAKEFDKEFATPRGKKSTMNYIRL